VTGYQEMLFSPHLILRRAVMACLRQLVQREAAEVSDHALSLASATPISERPASQAAPAGSNVVQRRAGITETGLEGALFGLLDRDTDRQLCSNVQDTLLSLLQALAADNLTRWLMLIKDVLQASSGISLMAEHFQQIRFQYFYSVLSAFSALTLLVWRQEGHPACKKPWGGGAVSPVGVAPTRTVGTSASIIFPRSIKIQKTGAGETQPERSTALC